MGDFLSALLAGTQDPIRLVYGQDATVDVTDDLAGALAQAGAEPVYLSPVTATGQVPFLYTLTENAVEDEWRDLIGIKPTVVLFKDGMMITAFALELPGAADDAAMIALAASMGGDLADPLADPIPTPGANGWVMIHCDESVYTAFADLESAYGVEPAAVAPTEAPTEDFGTLNDARLLTPFSLTDKRYQQEMVVSVGKGQNGTVWEGKPAPVAKFIERLSHHPVHPKKDGLAFVLAELVEAERAKNAVSKCYAVGLDIDGGVPGAVIDAELLKFGRLAVRYTTHSHGKTTSEVKKDTITGWLAKRGIDDVDLAGITRYLREEKRWDEAVLASTSYVGDVHLGKEGLSVQLEHMAMAKHRVVMPLAVPFEPAKVAKLHRDGMIMWGDVCRALGRTLGNLLIDRSAVDPSRLFYFPRHKADAPHETTIVGGDLLDWKDLDLTAGPVEVTSDDPAMQALLDEVQAVEKAKPTGKTSTDEGRKLGPWFSEMAERFLVADFLTDHLDGERIRTPGSEKIEIECPFDAGHTISDNPEDRACYAENAGSGDATMFVLKCMHDSCDGYTALDHLGKMVADDWIAREALDDPRYYSEEDGAPVEAIPNKALTPPTTDEVREAIKALPPKNEGPDIKPVLDMIARLDDHDDRETLISMVRAASGRALADLRKSVAERRKGVAKVAGADDHIVVDIKTGYRTFTYKGEPDHRHARAFLIDTMNLANKKAAAPLFSVNMGEPTALRRYDGSVSFQALEPKAFQAALFEYCSFAQHVEDGDLICKVPDADISGIVHAGLRPGELPDRPSIRRAPTIGKDGQVMDRDGWFGDVLVDLGDLAAPTVPENPTPAQVKESRDFLVNTVMGDFPFDDEDDDGARGKSKASTANAIAMTLTQFCRDQFKGPSPLFAIVKPAPGVGGTLLAEIPQRLFDGFASTTTPNSSREDEMEKLMSSAAMGNESFMFFDNVRNFQSDTVKRTCTSERIGGRKLGESLMVSRPNDLLWQITGINPRLDAEINRRCVYINLNLRREAGAKRTYQHENFKGWLTDNRSVVIGHILTLIRAWWVAGAKPSNDVMASFETWAGVIGGILAHAGIEGFLTNPREEVEDREGAEVKEFIVEWLKVFEEADTTEKRAFEVFSDEEYGIVHGYGGERLRNFKLMLDSLKGRTFEVDKRLMMFERAAQGWRLVEMKAVTS